MLNLIGYSKRLFLGIVELVRCVFWEHVAWVRIPLLRHRIKDYSRADKPESLRLWPTVHWVIPQECSQVCILVYSAIEDNWIRIQCLHQIAYDLWQQTHDTEFRSRTLNNGDAFPFNIEARNIIKKKQASSKCLSPGLL